jgi:hypothetical protein
VRTAKKASGLKPDYTPQEKPLPGAHPELGAKLVGEASTKRPDVDARQTDMTFTACPEPHFGQGLASWSESRDSSSKTWLHWGHAYSKMGMSLLLGIESGGRSRRRWALVRFVYPAGSDVSTSMNAQRIIRY